jgi:sigma-B regulation protein RsbU (phosphoserine phosphatase)
VSIKIGVLTSDDESRSVISRIGRIKGSEIIFLGNMDEVADRLQNDDSIASLVLDLDDPHLNQNTLLPYLHNEHPLLKVIVISSNCSSHLVRLAMHNGVFDFIPKPLNLKEFNLSLQKSIQAVTELRKDVNDYEDLLAIEHELDVARNIQSSIIPKQKDLSTYAQFEIAGRNQAAHKVGGDFYDYFMLDDDHLGFVIGDVASKGIAAAIFMAVSRTLFQSIALKGSDPATCLSKLNNILVLESDPSMFIAILYGILDLCSGEIVMANGGHTRPLLIRSDGKVNVPDHDADVVLGVVEKVDYQPSRIKINPGDILFAATDGFNELTDQHGRAVGDHFVKRNLIHHRRKHAGQIVDIIFQSAGQIHPDNQPLSDDLTCLLLKYTKGE